MDINSNSVKHEEATMHFKTTSPNSSAKQGLTMDDLENQLNYCQKTQITRVQVQVLKALWDALSDSCKDSNEAFHLQDQISAP